MQREADGYKKVLGERAQAQTALEAKVLAIQGERDEAKSALAQASKKNAAAIGKLTRELDETKAKLADASNNVSSKLRAIVEFWKAPHQPFALKRTEESPNMIKMVTDIFRKCSHQTRLYMGIPSRCHAFQKLQIARAETVHNPDLWHKYRNCKEALKKRHCALGVRVKPLAPAIHEELLPCLDGLNLDREVNEVLVVHGCTEKAARAIISEGFDTRHAGTHGGSLYGEGIYFCHQMCKSNQYTDQSGPSGLRHMIISRVALGDPKYLSNPYIGRLPPFRDDDDETKGRFDSNVVNPEDSARGQVHWECVIFSGEQAYPEMLITYTI